MTKRTIKETTREYDENGKLIRETVTETTEDNDTQYVPYFPTANPQYAPYWDNGITCGQFSTTSSARTQGGCSDE